MKHPLSTRLSRAAAPGRPKQGPTLAPDRPELVEGSPYSASGVSS
jgi:hypothetical protein